MKWILIPVTIRFTAVLGAENTSKLRCSHGGLSPSPANRLGFSTATKVMGKMSLKRVMTPEGRDRDVHAGQEAGKNVGMGALVIYDVKNVARKHTKH